MKKLFLLIVLICLSGNLLVANHNIDFVMPYKIKKAEKSFERFDINEHNSWVNQKENEILSQDNNQNLNISNSQYPESEITAAINPKDSSNIIVSPMRLRPREMGNLIFPIYYTKDFGETWNVSEFITYPPNNSSIMGGGDPVLVFDKDGIAYLTWIYLYLTIRNGEADSLQSAVFYAVSKDGGETWIEDDDNYLIGTKISSKVQGGSVKVTGINDKQWMASDYSNSQYSGNVYTCVTEITKLTTDMPSIRLMLYTKEYENDKFNPSGIQITDEKIFNCQFSAIDVDNNGYIHVTFYGQHLMGEFNLYHTVSKDGGITFSPSKVISGVTGIYSEKESVIGVKKIYISSYIAIDKYTPSGENNLYVAWSANGTDKNINLGMNVYFSMSSDGGNSWTEPMILNDTIPNTNNDCFYPSIAVNPQGKVVIAWYDRSRYSDNILTDYIMKYSSDNGNTFSDRIDISTASSDFSKIGLKNDEFGVGEYNQLVVTKDYLIPFWADGRTNNGDVCIYTAKIPLDGHTDVAERILPLNNTFRINSVFPNPASEQTNISISTDYPDELNIQIIDMSGKMILSYDRKVNHSIDLPIDLAIINPGMYILKVNNSSTFEIRKLIVE